jgi:hypothetical protein
MQMPPAWAGHGWQRPLGSGTHVASHCSGRHADPSPQSASDTQVVNWKPAVPVFDASSATEPPLHAATPRKPIARTAPNPVAFLIPMLLNRRETDGFYAFIDRGET